MAEVVKDLWESFNPKHYHTQLFVQDHVQMASRDEDSTASGKWCECLVNLSVKKCFLIFRGNPEFSYVLIASGPVTRHP